MVTLELEILTPKPQDEQIEAIRKKINEIGLEKFNSLQKFEHIKNEIESPRSQKNHIYWQLVYEFINNLAEKDPNHLHYDIVREAIEDDLHEIPDKTLATDMLVRGLNEFCKTLKIKLKERSEFYTILETAKEESKHIAKEAREPENPSLEILDIPEEIASSMEFEKDGMLIWDMLFLQHLNTTGKYGKDHVKPIKKIRKERLLEFKRHGQNPLGFWFNLSSNNQPLHLSPALIIATKALWQDKIKRCIIFSKKNLPALTVPVQESIQQIMSPHNRITRDEEKFQLLHSEKQIVVVQIPAISQSITTIVFNGLKKFNSVTGHKLIRFFTQQAFNRMTTGDLDPQVFRFERGSTDIACQMGLGNSRQNATYINQILHAMAYCEFETDRLSGNLIQLTKYKSSITHRNEAYLIYVGAPLLPHQTFEDGGLLIPLLSDPPLVNPNQYHAGQYFLQMEVMNEMSSQSIFLAQNGVICLPQEQWSFFAKKSGIPHEILTKIQDKWTQDGTEHSMFLKKVENDFYTLGPEHEKALEFLTAQGLHRINQSNKGKASSEKRSLQAKKQKCIN